MSDKTNIIIALNAFRGAHQLGSDDVYDDIVAATIQSVESDYLSHYRELAGMTNDDLTDEKKEQVLKALCHQVFNRLLQQPSNFMLSEESGKEAREIQRAVDNEMAQCHRMIHLLHVYAKSSDYVPALARKNDIMQDLADTIIGSSRQAVSVTDDIVHAATYHAVKNSLLSVSHASTGLHASGIAIQGFNFLMVPAFYIYYAAKREPVPFTVSNNIKWGLSSVALALTIIGFAVPPAGIAIMFTMVGIGLVASIAGLTTHIYERIQTKKQLGQIQKDISNCRSKIEDNHHEMMKLRKDIAQHRADPQCYMKNLQNDAKRLEALTAVNTDLHQSLKADRVKQAQLKLTAFRSHANLQTVNTGLQVVLASAFLVGAVLMVTPYTAPVGLIILAVAGSLGFASFIADKIYQIRINRIARNKNSEEAPSVVVHPSTYFVSESLDPSHDHKEVKTPLVEKNKDKQITAVASVVKQEKRVVEKQEVIDDTDEDGKGIHPPKR